MGTVHTPTAPVTAAPPRPRLHPKARLDVEQAREFLGKLSRRTRGADQAQALLLLGQLSGHAQALIDVIDAVAP